MIGSCFPADHLKSRKGADFAQVFDDKFSCFELRHATPKAKPCIDSFSGVFDQKAFQAFTFNYLQLVLASLSLIHKPSHNRETFAESLEVEL